MRALIVDDSRFARRHLREMLEREGIACEDAADGRSAMEALHAGGEFELALVDWNMPGMTGLELVKLLRREGFDAMKVMMVTTEGETEAITRALEAGADEFLMKPFDEEALREKLALMGVGEGWQ